jgi:hypothetical protein
MLTLKFIIERANPDHTTTLHKILVASVFEALGAGKNFAGMLFRTMARPSDLLQSHNTGLILQLGSQISQRIKI